MTRPLILASASETRRLLLQRAGVQFEVRPSAIDEGSLKIKAEKDGLAPVQTALLLAAAKARDVSDLKPQALVLGADQILVQDGKLYDKPETIDEARAHLMSFRDRTHELISAAVLFQDGTEVWQAVETATLSVRDFSDEFMNEYLVAEGDRLFSSVGAYRLESLGSQLFTKISGNHATILGLPLLRLLEELRNRGILKT